MYELLIYGFAPQKNIPRKKDLLRSSRLHAYRTVVFSVVHTVQVYKYLVILVSIIYFTRSVLCKRVDQMCCVGTLFYGCLDLQYGQFSL